MRIVADLHVHSRYAMATSPTMDLGNLDAGAKLKGVTVIGTGDFTHPAWFREIQTKLEPAEPGLFKLRKNSAGTKFLLQTEVSCIYKKHGRVRKLHMLALVPNMQAAGQLNKKLANISNLKADGRPTLLLDAREFLTMVLGVAPEAMVIPAHIWTPWFGVFGSKSGFDSLEECFEDDAKYIYACETGLDSTPEMNWRVSNLDKVALISNGDCHSTGNIAREANVFETELSYEGICMAIKSKNPEKFLYTLEFFPEVGKYHWDGHRKCNVGLAPGTHNGICPRCKKKLTIGVLNRIQALADRPADFAPKHAIASKHIIPLKNIIADALEVAPGTKAVQKQYGQLLSAFGNEIAVLLDIGQQEIEKASSATIAADVLKVRQGQVAIKPGYDGLYGNVKV